MLGHRASSCRALPSSDIERGTWARQAFVQRKCHFAIEPSDTHASALEGVFFVCKAYDSEP